LLSVFRGKDSLEMPNTDVADHGSMSRGMRDADGADNGLMAQK
jgi:hypothetical protein